MKHLQAVLAGALTLYALSSDCLGAPLTDVRTEAVRFADLDLAHPAGAQELYRRIQSAARDVCESDGAAGHLGGYQDCLRAAIARAVAEVGAPLLAEHHRELTGGATSQAQQVFVKK